jgi:purine-binding chemotaxis protein CheW
MNIQALAKNIPVEGEYSLEGIDFITSGEQYLMFQLADEIFAVNILCVEEIRSWEKPTKIPNAPFYVMGVINMRGIIVPIMDLRLLFGMGDVTYTKTTVVVVLTIETAEQTKTMGFVVDAVTDVLNVEENDIKPAPAFGSAIAQQYIQGLVNLSHEVVTLLNVEALQVIEPHADV